MVKKLIPVVITPVASMALLISIAGCAGGMPPAGGGGNGGGPDPGPAEVSFKDDIQPILLSVCVTCHTPNGIADQRGIPLRLDGSDGFSGFFTGSSVQDPSLPFIVAGDPDNSLVYLKASRDNPPVGARMPLPPIPALTQAEQDTIRTWIAEGAANN